MFWPISSLKAALTVAGIKRRDNGPMAAQVESKESASHVSRPIDKHATRCVASKADPKLWELARSLPTKELETETNPERRRNIEACLNYINKNGYPYPDEVLIVMDGVVKHVTEDESLAMDWASLNASGKTDEAFLMVSRYPSLPAIGNFWLDLTVNSLDLSMGLIHIAWWRGEVELVPGNGFPWGIEAWQCRLPRFAACYQIWSVPTGMVIILASWENGKTAKDRNPLLQPDGILLTAVSAGIHKEIGCSHPPERRVHPNSQGPSMGQPSMG